MPNDPVMLLSYVNTQLRDFYPSLDSFCEANGVSAESICRKLETILISLYRFEGRTAAVMRRFLCGMHKFYKVSIGHILKKD